jgi:hypothetical protein
VSRSRTSICTSSLGYACLAALALCACPKDASPIAELTDAKGPVERQDGGEPWRPAKLGTQYFLGDAARTWDGGATLAVAGGAAKIMMQRQTVLRFGGVPGQNRISVELGVIALTGTGDYSLDVGDVKLSPNATVQIAARGAGRTTFELQVGEATVATRTGQTFDLEIGKAVDVERDARPPVDAAVPDAPAEPEDAAIDAAIDAPGEDELVGGATIEVTGRRAELLSPGETTWQPLPAGAGALAPGSTVRLGPGTSAKATANNLVLALAGGARFKLGDDLVFALEGGDASAAASAPATLGLPGGAVAFAGSPRAAAEARLDGGNRDTRVTMTRGGSKLTGTSGAQLALSRGETASLGKNGAIRVIEAIPSYFDLRVVVGESLTIHDPRPPTAVQFQFYERCPEGGIIEVDRDGRFRTPKLSSGRDFANMMVGAGAWWYRLRCTSGGAEGGAVVTGRIATVRDDGRRPLPRAQAVNEIDADGRNYRISYQSTIPSVVVRVRNPGAAHRLHLASGGKAQTFESSSSTITVPGGQLHEGTYTFWIDRDGVKQDKVTTLTIDFDQTAPQVYIEAPLNGEPWQGDIYVRGAVLPGWSAVVGAVTIPVDRQRRFSAKVGIPGGNALAIRLSHPQRGVHYYLRRPTK